MYSHVDGAFNQCAIKQFGSERGDLLLTSGERFSLGIS